MVFKGLVSSSMAANMAKHLGSVAAGEQFAGRSLAAADVSVAGWPAVTERVAMPVATAATLEQVDSIRPPDRMSRLVPGRV